MLDAPVRAEVEPLIVALDDFRAAIQRDHRQGLGERPTSEVAGSMLIDLISTKFAFKRGLLFFKSFHVIGGPSLKPPILLLELFFWSR